MSRPPIDLLKRVFPVRHLFRGQPLRALLWSIVGMIGFTGMLLSAFLVVALFNSQGIISIDADEIDAYEQLFEPVEEPAGAAEAGREEIVHTAPLQLTDLGLKAVAWESRHRAWGQALAALCRQFPALQSTETAMVWLLIVGLASGLIHSVVMSHAAMLASRAASHTVGQLRHSLHRHALRMGISDLNDEHIPDVMRLFTTEVETVRAGIEQWIIIVFRSPLRLAVLLVICLSLNWMVTFECLVPLVACWYLIRRERKHLERAQALNLDRAEADLKRLGEGIHKSRLIRGFQLEDFEDARFGQSLERYQGRLTDIERRQRHTEWLARVFFLAALALVLFLLGSRMLALPGEPGHLTLPEGLLLLSCFALGWRPLESIAALRRIRSEAGQAAERIYRYLNTIPEVSQAVGAKFLQPLEKLVEYQAVTCRIGKRTVLNRLNLKIPANGTTALVAFDPLEARAMATLLPRFIEPHEGKVLIDGEDINWATLESLRAEVLFVGGEAPWFTGTALENITGGDPRYALSQATEAAKTVHAHNFIQKLPQGYETAIGEHGEQLNPSRGFRLALARALLRDPALLIIEEPSGEFTEAEKAHLDDAMRRVVASRTTIILPSRLTTLRSVDRIVLVNKGRVEVVGTHEALLQKSTLYRHWEYMHFNEFRHETSPAR